MLNRRTFLKLVGLGGIVFFTRGLLGSHLLKQVLIAEEPPLVHTKEKKFGMVIDVGACIGCRRCLYACKEENNVPDRPNPMAWIEVFEMDNTEPITEIHSVPQDRSKTTYTEAPREGKWYLSKNCFHCENPPCVKVCPVGATYKDEDGIVAMDYDLCIGCRYCMSACPYNARTFNWLEPEISPERVNPQVPVRHKGVVEKCTFCSHRVREGKLPRCVEVCPVGARHFGDLNDPESPVYRLLRSKLSFRLLEEMNTEPRVYYITSGKKWIPEEV